MPLEIHQAYIRGVLNTSNTVQNPASASHDFMARSNDGSFPSVPRKITGLARVEGENESPTPRTALPPKLHATGESSFQGLGNVVHAAVNTDVHHSHPQPKHPQTLHTFTASLLQRRSHVLRFACLLTCLFPLQKRKSMRPRSSSPTLHGIAGLTTVDTQSTHVE